MKNFYQESQRARRVGTKTEEERERGRADFEENFWATRKRKGWSRKEMGRNPKTRKGM